MDQQNDFVVPRIKLTQGEIARKSGISQSTVSYILKGDRFPSKKMAERLEESTGICKEAWMWPESHHNPYMAFVNPNVCAICPHRAVRIKGLTKIIDEHMKRSKNKLETARWALDFVSKFNGVSDRVVLSLREIVPEGLKKIYTTGPIDVAPDVLAEEEFPWLVGELRAGRIVHIPVHPLDLPVEAQKERALGNKIGVKSHISVPNGNAVFMIASLTSRVVWTTEMIHEIEKFTGVLRKALGQ